MAEKQISNTTYSVLSRRKENSASSKKGSETMYCLYCDNAETKVLESRILDDSMRRRRECLACSNRFTTYEKASFSLSVQKKDERIQPFEIQKIVNSFVKACGKVEDDVAQSLARKVQQKVLRKKTNPITSTIIGKYVLQELKKFDKIAYLRFASIYKNIDDPKLLEKEISLLA